MSNVVEIDERGQIVYKGLLSSKQTAEIDEIINTLKEEIPEIENNLKKQYGSGALYRYYLGKVLGEYLVKYDVSVLERRKFWDEIKKLASQEERKRDEGKNSEVRSFYHQCYELSKLNKNTVEKLSARQWHAILDRVSPREDKRIYQWIEEYPDKIREDDWRTFLKGLNIFLKEKDTSVFEKDELFSIYNSIMLMSQKWRILINEYEKEHPKSEKTRNKTGWSKKYMTKCFYTSREKDCLVNEKICDESFEEIMKP